MRYDGETGNAPWHDEGHWRAPRAWAKRYSPVEPTPHVTDAPIPGDPTPCADFPDMWFSEKTNERDMAKRTCTFCWMRQDCRDYGLSNPEIEGIWGGLSKADRARRKR